MMPHTEAPTLALIAQLNDLAEHSPQGLTLRLMPLSADQLSYRLAFSHGDCYRHEGGTITLTQPDAHQQLLQLWLTMSNLQGLATH